MNWRSSAQTILLGLALFVFISCVLFHCYEDTSKATRKYSIQSMMTEKDTRDKLLAHYEVISRNAERRKRLPDIIGIGAEKCGSGALINFLRHHPLIKVRTMEVHFFDGHYHKGLEYYKQKLADAADFELLMEKTPAYFNKPEINVPKMIKQDVPDAKLIVILCDPVNRTFSDFVHEQVSGTVPKDMRFEVFIDQYLSHFEGNPFEGMDDRSAASYIKVKDQNFHLSHLISTGLYYYHMKHWYEYYNASNLYIVDGEELLSNPGKVVDEIQNFLGLPRLLIPEDFQKNNDTGFYCVRTVAAELNNGPECLESFRKGRTRMSNTRAPETTMKKLREFYRPYNEKLFKFLGRNFAWQ